MSIKLTRWRGLAGLVAELGIYAKEIQELRLARALSRAAALIQRDARAAIGGLSGLRNRTGRLRASITWDLRRTRKGNIVAKVGPEGMPQKLYGWIQETGSTSWSSRPFLTPATERNRRNFERLVGSASDIFSSTKRRAGVS